MVWIAPEVTRTQEPVIGDERAMLDGWLDWHRMTLLTKCAGLTGEQLVERSVPPSTLSLLGLVRHMTYVERVWFRLRVLGEQVAVLHSTPEDPDADLHDTDPARAEAEFAAFHEEIDLVRAGVKAKSLDDTFTTERDGTRSLRWVYLHMIEEYARHNGHADLLRERVDGVTGD
ncbi:DinB family protein [Actinocrispum wychmicini]|nr:DinB family protein [Actinocrispum wychmicini]